MSNGESTKAWSAVWRQYQRFIPYARPDSGYFLLDVISIVIAVITNTAMIYLMGQPLTLIQRGEYDALPAVLVLFAGVILFNQAIQFGGGWLTNWLTVSFIGRVRNALMEKTILLS
ncbi:hypothetical protein, partial [Kaarinaea lacus]